jgi:hypothetical protein
LQTPPQLLSSQDVMLSASTELRGATSFCSFRTFDMAYLPSGLPFPGISALTDHQVSQTPPQLLLSHDVMLSASSKLRGATIFCSLRTFDMDTPPLGPSLDRVDNPTSDSNPFQGLRMEAELTP